MYTLSHLKTFIRVVELNNFSAAARELGLTVAAVSKHISQLESSLDIKLIERTTRKIQLTAVGHQYYLECKNVFRAVEHAESVVRQTQSKPSGKLKVKSERYFAERFIVPRIDAFYKQYPDVQLWLESEERVPDLIAEEFDLVVGRNIQQHENVMHQTISTTNFTLCASPDYLKRRGVPKVPKDLIHHDYLSHLSRIPNDELEFGRSEKIYLPPRLLINDSDALLHCAINGLGFIKLQHYVVADALEKGELIEILSHYKNPVIAINLYYEPAKWLQTKVQAFAQFFCQGLPEIL